MLRPVCVFLALLFGIVEVRGELYTALVDLEKVLHAEHAVAQDLRAYVQSETQRLARLQRLADDFETHSTDALSDVELYLSNPVNAYLLIKRLTTEFDEIVNRDIKSNATEAFLDSLSSKTGFFPDEEDLKGAVFALMRLQDTYALPAYKIANGELQGVKNSVRLTAQDCFILGITAYKNSDFYHSIIWLHQTLDSMKVEYAGNVDKANVLEHLAFAYYKQGNLLQALEYTVELLQLEPNHDRAQKNKNAFEREILDLALDTEHPYNEEEIPVNPRPLRANFDYEKLCRGEETQERRGLHRLTCRYKRDQPYFYIRPAKEEEMSLSPRLVVYHDLITGQEIRKIKELATPKLKRSTILSHDAEPKIFTQDNRISKSGWLDDHEDPLISKFSRKASLISNLRLETADYLQVLNYGIGGYYETHYDFDTGNKVDSFGPWRGNRVATFLCYLSDVGAGGGTAFPSIGVHVSPVKGSCAFWYNLFPSGKGDLKTNHAACPVLSGFKWVSNKWFHERGQEFIRPCKLSQFDER